MPIELEWIDGLSCPFFVCDICSTRITDAPMAMIAWSESLEDMKLQAAHIDFIYVHKGKCLQNYERYLPKGHHLMTTGLREHIQQLIHNSTTRRR